MKLKYKYDPQDYEACHLLSDDMRAFYIAYEKHKNEPNNDTEFELKQAYDLLYFSIKHRAVEECITDQERNEMWAYFEELKVKNL